MIVADAIDATDLHRSGARHLAPVALIVMPPAVHGAARRYGAASGPEVSGSPLSSTRRAVRCGLAPPAARRLAPGPASGRQAASEANPRIQKGAGGCSLVFRLRVTRLRLRPRQAGARNVRNLSFVEWE